MTFDKAKKLAQANADRTGQAWHVNSCTDGFRAERRPLVPGWSGYRTVARLEPSESRGETDA